MSLDMKFSFTGGSDLMDCAFGYFITASIVISLAIVSYIILLNLVSIKIHNLDNDFLQTGNITSRIFLSPAGILPILPGEKPEGSSIRKGEKSPTDSKW